MYKYKLVLIGDIDLPENIHETFSKDGFLITKAGGDDSYFEMSGESLYYALTDIERKYNKSMLDYKSMVVNAIYNRVENCEGILLHNSLAQNGERDTQLRASNSAIRTLIMARHDGYDVDNLLIKLLNYHYLYYFIWHDGVWFCHDVSEKEGKQPKTHIKSKVLGKENRNTLTLNTHLDSLNTLLLLKKEKIDLQLSFSVDELINKGVISVNQLLTIKASWINLVMQRVDGVILKRVDYCEMKLLSGFWARIVHPLLFKLFMPTVFFKNGYIARDLAVLNIHMDYLVVNVVDFARFMNLYRKVYEQGDLMYKELLCRLSKAVGLIENSKTIKSYIESSDLLRAWYAEMYFTLSNIDDKYLMKATKLSAKKIYNTYSPFFKDCFNEI